MVLSFYSYTREKASLFVKVRILPLASPLSCTALAVSQRGPVSILCDTNFVTSPLIRACGDFHPRFGNHTVKSNFACIKPRCIITRDKLR